MKIPLRYFLLVCILLGAVAVPWGWRVYETYIERLAAKKAAKSAQQELSEERRAFNRSTLRTVVVPTSMAITQYKVAAAAIKAEAARLESPITSVRGE